jgi:hypothetical protein
MLGTCCMRALRHIRFHAACSIKTGKTSSTSVRRRRSIVRCIARPAACHFGLWARQDVHRGVFEAYESVFGIGSSKGREQGTIKNLTRAQPSASSLVLLPEQGCGRCARYAGCRGRTDRSARARTTALADIGGSNHGYRSNDRTNPC